MNICNKGIELLGKLYSRPARDGACQFYIPISLNRLQRLVDLGRLDERKVIDITALINANAIHKSQLVNTLFFYNY